MKTEVRLHDTPKEEPPCWLLTDRVCTHILTACCVGFSATSRPKTCGCSFCQPRWRIRFHLSQFADQVRKDPKQGNWWVPTRSCEAVIPVCTYASLSKDATVACIAYPAETMNGTNFEAAAFTVNKLDEATADECLQVTEPHPATSHKVKINGETFDAFDVGGAAAGSFSAADAYRNFHQNRCYELDVRVAAGNIANFDPRTVKEFDYKAVDLALRSVLNTFKFLK